jgi:hypothetical protein
LLRIFADANSPVAGLLGRDGVVKRPLTKKASSHLDATFSLYEDKIIHRA